MERVDDVLHRHADRHRLLAVDVEEQPGGAGGEVAEQAAEAWVARAFLDQRRDGRFERLRPVVAPILHDEFEAGDAAEPVDRRRLEHLHHSPLDPRTPARADPRGDSAGGGRRPVPAGEGLEEEVHAATVGGVGPEDERLAGDPQAVDHARLATGERLDLPHDRRRALHTRPVWERHFDDEIALVLLGDEADGGFREQPPGEPEQGDEHQEDRDADPQRQSNEGRIGRRDHGEEPIESPEQPAEQQPQEPIDRIGGRALRLEE